MSLFTARADPILPERLREVWIGLGCADKMAQQVAAGRVEGACEVTEAVPEGLGERCTMTVGDLWLDVVQEGVHHNCCCVGQSAIDRDLRDACGVCDPLDGDAPAGFLRQS
ncbi:hypothetical protein EV132_101682 [Rhizobium sullae]|uniref:Uncharacterized protein n=1 Tax=Rhizobium sullae TaxID=50338 RepID=A0A4V2VAD5_RHISU|nr:hypothetical protein [Rhizobium sullae]TCU20615.1 hypothetical protein EV132_101682 [Rhizobium sullae]